MSPKGSKIVLPPIENISNNKSGQYAYTNTQNTHGMNYHDPGHAHQLNNDPRLIQNQNFAQMQNQNYALANQMNNHQGQQMNNNYQGQPSNNVQNMSEVQRKENVKEDTCCQLI
jgi:hypothetical protein